MSKDEKENLTEKIPSHVELFHLVKELAAKCGRLETELHQVRNTMNIRQRKEITEWMNTARQTVSTDFNSWCRGFTVTETHLNKMFTTSITEAIKTVLSDEIKKHQKIPIAAFTQKPNSLYVYKLDETTKNSEHHLKWKHLHSEDMETLIGGLVKKLLTMFVKWQTDNYENIISNEKLKDNELYYMGQLIRASSSPEKINAEIKKWLYTELEENIESCYDFV
jgi:antitoxin component of RelBE/YafQ-DinJ toxin-antitoxin module